MFLQGKGMTIWKILSCEGGNPVAIADVAKTAGFSYVVIKIADAGVAYNYDKVNKKDLIPPVVDALRSKGISVWGWQYVYGYDPLAEARIAISQMKKYGMDGFVIDAEQDYKLAGRDAVARTYMSELRKELPATPMALNSYRWPSYHPTFPWTAFLEKCDLNMPQVYWMLSHDPQAQLQRSVDEFAKISPVRPIVPMGPAFSESGWTPTADEITWFMQKARALNLSAVNFFSWDESHVRQPAIWNAIAKFPWPVDTSVKDITDLYIDALNTHNPDMVTALYAPDAVHITGQRTLQGPTYIRGWYDDLITHRFPDNTFNLTGMDGNGSTRHFTWTTSSPYGNITDGNDTFGLVDGKIAYHYTYFNVT